MTLIEIRADESSEHVVVCILDNNDQFASVPAAVLETAKARLRVERGAVSLFAVVQMPAVANDVFGNDSFELRDHLYTNFAAPLVKMVD